jgi:class 3 adenylate cyclase
MLGLRAGSVVPADILVELLWGDDPPRTAAKALQTHISSLRRSLGDGFVLTEGAGWILSTAEIDASRYTLAAKLGRDAMVAGDASEALARFEEALALWRGAPELPDCQRGTGERTRWIEGHAALVEDRADVMLATGRAAELIGELEAAVGEAPLRERRWGQLMLALYRAGRQGEALGAYKRARSLLSDELGVDPGPDLRRLEAAIVAQDVALEITVAQPVPSVTRAVTFLLTDIEGSTTAWEADAEAMAVALVRHDELVEQAVTSRGGRLIKTRGEGDATFSVFDRPSAAAFAAIELQDAVLHEPWALPQPMRIRVALHTGEAELRDGDYFGRAVNRAARLRSLAAGGQIVCSGAAAELVIDSLPDDVVLADLGLRQLRNLARPEHVFELRMQTAEDAVADLTTDTPMERPSLPTVLSGPGPFVGRGHELERLQSAWHSTLGAGVHAVLIAGEPGVGKTRLAGEWSRQVYEQGAVVIYGRCDEDLGAPYQPFAEALRSLAPCLGDNRLRGIRGVEALLPLVPGLTDVLPDIAAPTRADPDTERYALFDAVVALLSVAATCAPVVLVLDDLHWAAKSTLLLLRHLLRFGEHAHVQIVGTYRSTDLDRSHPLAAMLADLHRDGTADRIALSGLDEDDVTAFVAEAGYDDEELARALASVTGGNPFFLIEALRHVDESGGVWDSGTLPQGVREAVSRRLSRLPAETNKALAAAAVVGSRFAVDLVERVVDRDLVDAFDEACQAGILVEEPGGRYRFNHAIVRQSLLAELASVRRMRLHQRIATTLESGPDADDELLAELAYHYFECAWAGNAAKAVFYCRRAADQAMARLAYEGAADLYDQALHALEEIDTELPDRESQTAELLIARCEALLAAGDVASAEGVVRQLQEVTRESARFAAWATCFEGQLSMLIHPERLDEVESAVSAAAERLAGLGDAAGEAMAHTVRATCLGRLGRVAECEIALDDALTAARRAREHRRVNAVLAGAPLAALWGPNPVPRAGGRCLDVVRLLRITTDSPAVEATSTRCQAVLEAFRGRAAAARRMIDSARRTVAELGLRHALLEVEQFAGIVDLVADDPPAAEPHLRNAYNGFRRMGLDADTAETAALLGRACLELGRDGEADELCSESERLAGHALKPAIAWRTLRAQLLARGGEHDAARRIAEEAVGLAERTDGLVDHGDACLALATVLDAAGDVAGARAAAERAFGLYERKGAAALVDKARHLLDERAVPGVTTPPEAPIVELENMCVRVIDRLDAAVGREAWGEVEQLAAPDISVESRRKIVGFPRIDLSASEWTAEGRRYREMLSERRRNEVVAVRGERLALTRLVIGTADVSPGAPQDEALQLYGLDEQGRLALQVWFDVEDIDAAVAELDSVHTQFEAEHPQSQRLENKASQAAERYQACFAARDWAAMAALVADDFVADDRRRVVNAGVRHGREVHIADTLAAAELGAEKTTSSFIAIRGERLVLARVRTFNSVFPDELGGELLAIVEIDHDNRMVAHVLFEAEDIDAAVTELDARYVAGDAAPYAHAWSLIASAYAGFNRRELPPMTPDSVNVDHRRATAMAPGEGAAYFHTSWELAAELNVQIEAVHRLSDLGAVVTHVGTGTSRDGFEAEWRTVDVMTVDGDLIERVELFDESDIDVALTRFDQLSRPTRRLENAASRLYDRFNACLAVREWNAMAEMIADDICSDDRRRVVRGGVQRGRDAQTANLRAVVDIGVKNIESLVIATRGEHLVLTSTRGSGGVQRPDTFSVEMLSVIEINAHNRITAGVLFDVADVDAAFAELDARYEAGEAATYAGTWSALTATCAAVNRHDHPPTTRDFVFIDHIRLQRIEADHLTATVDAIWELLPDFRSYIEAVHRLSAIGGVTTWMQNGTSRDEFGAEWRHVNLFTFDGDLISRCELFDEADLDTAIARFDELQAQAHMRGPENSASQVDQRFWKYFAARDWDAMAAITVDDVSIDDRRHVINAGVQRGRSGHMADMRAIAEVGAENTKSTAIATRGERLVLTRVRSSNLNLRPEEISADVLSIVEIDTDNRIVAHVGFDIEDIDAAFAELDARYLAGEAVANAHTWSVITQALCALNQREALPTTPDWVNIDHRRHGTSFAPGELPALLGLWNLAPVVSSYTEVVHRLNNRGAVLTSVSHEISQDGVNADWRVITVLTVKGDLIDRSEFFDEADLDTAIARFDELQAQSDVRGPENAASRANDRMLAYFNACDWDAVAKDMAADYYSDDRRPLVNTGLLQGRDVAIANSRTTAGFGVTFGTSDVIATRGSRLVLSRTRWSGPDQGPEAFRTDVLTIVELDATDHMVARVWFDANDIDAAVAELDVRYLAGEAAPYAGTWSVVTGVYTAFNQQEFPARTQDWTIVDHRPLLTIMAADYVESVAAIRNLTPDLRIHVAAVHRLSDGGAVVSHAANGVTPDGFEAERRMVFIYMVDGDLVSSCEIFDETDLDAALARFDELNQGISG